MAAGFRYSHRDITNLDIRHIYSGELLQKSYRLKPPVFHEGIDYLERIHETITRPRVSKLPGKSFEYSREYNIVIPRAPAFRRFSKSEVDTVVSRLTTRKDPKQSDNDKTDTRLASAPPDIARNEKKATQRPVSQPAKKLSQEHINDMVNRLYRSRTQSTELKQREKVNVAPSPVPKAESEKEKKESTEDETKQDNDKT